MDAGQVSAATREMVAGKTARFVLFGSGTALTDSWTNGLKKGFEQAGMKFELVESNLDPTLYTQQLETAINDKVDVLVTANFDVSSSADLLQKAQDAGIYTILLGIGSVQQTDAFVGPDWIEMSKLLAGRVANDCKAAGKTDVALLLGFGTDAGTVLAEQGFKEVFDQQGIDIVSSQPAQYDPNKAREITATLLQQHPDLCAVVGTLDTMMFGAAEAVRQAGKTGDVLVYTTDSSSAACDAIKSGDMTAIVNYGVPDTGPIIVAVTKFLLQSGLKPGANRTALFTPMTIIDKTNVDDPSACYSGQL
ncbi:MAG: sugar ABC transporter substrate-binding protein [Ilumatobacteraceae bacterium]